ncbi:MAG: hypothetical protein K6A34_08680 [Methanobrevibacter sp.]|nr:hypothetical protein [Methanobrevibacter sp.]
MSAKTTKNVLVEYPIEVVYDTLIYLFPVRDYKLSDNDHRTFSVTVKDSSNYAFIMNINLEEKTRNTTMVKFVADFPQALIDITGGGKKAINIILEELLNELDKKSKPDLTERDKAVVEKTNAEVLDSNKFVNPIHTETNTKLVVIGYLLCALCFVLPIIMVILYEPHSSLIALLGVITVLALSFGIVISAILQSGENKRTIMHGRIQTCLFGFLFIFAGLFKFIFVIIGILIPVIIIGYFTKRKRSYE